MLIIDHPEIADTLKAFRAGLIPFRDNIEHRIRLVIKAPIGAIHAAILKGHISFYITMLATSNGFVPVLNTAFPDDPDEPFVLTTPFFDGLFDDFGEMLSYSKLEIHMLDEHNREWGDFNTTLERVVPNPLTRDDLLMPDFSLETNEHILEVARQEFGRRTTKEDSESTKAVLGINGLPNSLYYIDTAEEINRFHGGVGVVVSDLERKNPGLYQETDIAICLCQIPGLEVFVNPSKLEDSKEIADVIAISPKRLFVIQAKDSPNSQEFLEKTLDRKTSVALKHLRKAIRQTTGARSYIRQSENQTLSFFTQKGDSQSGIRNEFKFNISKLTISSIIVVKEVYIKKAKEYQDLVSAIILSGSSSIVLGYYSFYSLCKIAKTPEELANIFEEFGGLITSEQTYPNPESFVVSYIAKQS